MTTRYLSVFLPLLQTDRLRRRTRRRGETPHASCASADVGPLVTILKVGGAQRIAAVDAAAAGAGIRSGMTLADARALCPGLAVAEADPAAGVATLTAVVDWCRRFTPLAALDGADGSLLDIGGVAHLFGGEAALLDAVEAGLQAQGFAARGAIAATPEAAWALSRFSTLRIAPMESDPAFERLVADLPVAALRLDAETIGGLAQAGLRRIGDLMLRPRAPVTARFGSDPHARLDGLLGRNRSSISPRFAAPPYVVERRFLSGITRQEDIEAALLPLARQLCVLLSRGGEGARGIEAMLFRVDGVVKRIALGLGRPNRDPEVILGLLRERLASLAEEGLDTGYGFDLIRLSVIEAEAYDEAQGDLAGGQDDGDLTVLCDRLGARLGMDRVLRLDDCGSHIPERAVASRPAVRAPRHAGAMALPVEALPCRPIRLFETPEPIEAIAEVPDGPPLRFRWRRVVHEIAACEGPERIASEWWRPGNAPTRDYFRAEDREGRRFWLFREGLLGRETLQARWFLHGLFG